MRNDALGVAGRARCVRQRYRVPFINRERPCERRISGFQERLVVHLTQEFATAGQCIVDVDYKHFTPYVTQGR